MAKPDLIPWATDGGAAVSAPSSGKISTGWVPSEKPPAEWWNYLQNNAYLWQKYREEEWQRLRMSNWVLINSGLAGPPNFTSVTYVSPTQAVASSTSTGFYVADNAGDIHRYNFLSTGGSWSSFSSTMGGTQINKITTVDGDEIIAIGNDGKIAVSQNGGAAFTQYTTGASHWNDIAAPGQNLAAVVVGQAGALASSVLTDFTTWVSRTSQFGATNIESVAYGNSIYVAVGNDKCSTSADGITWTARTVTFGTTGGGTRVKFLNNLFWATGANAVGRDELAYSADGITWTYPTTGLASTGVQIIDIAWNGKKYVAVGTSGGSKIIIYSTDGTTWSSATLPTTPNLGSFVFLLQIDDSFIAPTGTACLTSINGEEWLLDPTPMTGPPTAGVSAAGVLFLIGNSGRCCQSMRLRGLSG